MEGERLEDDRARFLIRYAGGFAPFVVARAEGAWIETTEGRGSLDFTSGQICSTLGHNHPRIAAAVERAIEEVVHLNSWMLSEPVLAHAQLPRPLGRHRVGQLLDGSRRLRTAPPRSVRRPGSLRLPLPCSPL